MRILTRICAFALVLLAPAVAEAQGGLLVRSTGAGQGYGLSGYSAFTSTVDMAFSSSSVTVAASFESLASMSLFDALLLNIGSALTAGEIANIQAYSQGGGRVALLGGYHPTWNVWMPAIAQASGNITMNGAISPGFAVPVGASPLTSGVTSMTDTDSFGYFGIGAGATSLFVHGGAPAYTVMALGGPSSNVLVTGSSTFLLDANFYTADNEIFASNIAEWLADSESSLPVTATPEPASALLVLTGLLAFGVVRRRRA